MMIIRRRASHPATVSATCVSLAAAGAPARPLITRRFIDLFIARCPPRAVADIFCACACHAARRCGVTTAGMLSSRSNLDRGRAKVRELRAADRRLLTGACSRSRRASDRSTPLIHRLCPPEAPPRRMGRVPGSLVTSRPARFSRRHHRRPNNKAKPDGAAFVRFIKRGALFGISSPASGVFLSMAERFGDAIRVSAR